MISFNTFILREAHKSYLKMGEKLSRIEQLIDWETFHPIIASSYKNSQRDEVDQTSIQS
jgi:hypothetical protein